jgi:hypothetical protein
MDAKRHSNDKFRLPDGSMVSIVIWELPQRTQERPHGFKYRLNYCTADGATLLRYDNEKSKGDHKHLDDKQVPYKFQSIDQLVDDFWRDVDEILEKRQNE